MKRLLQILMSSAVLVLCLPSGAEGAPKPGELKEIQDDSGRIAALILHPGTVRGEGDLRLGLEWNDSMADGHLRLVATAAGFMDVLPGPSLHFRIDGAFVSLTPDRPAPGRPGRVGRSYSIPVSFVEDLLEAEEVEVRLDLEGLFAEGDFRKCRRGSACRGFKQFLKRLRRIRKQREPSQQEK